jgi:hypothetical protein
MKKTIFAALSLISAVVSADAQQFSADEIARRTVERRAIEAVIWGWFDGGRSYRLRGPPNPPIKLFWSVTIYDVDTRALILNEQKIADRSSRMDLRKNADGSVDIYCGPKAPAGFEKNWIPTVPGKNWFAYFRFYQPTEAYFDRSWPLPDFEQV